MDIYVKLPCNPTEPLWVIENNCPKCDGKGCEDCIKKDSKIRKVEFDYNMLLWTKSGELRLSKIFFKTRAEAEQRIKDGR